MKGATIAKTAIITAMAQVVNEAWLEKYLMPQLTREYQNDREDFLGILPKVPAQAVGKEGIYKNRLVTQPEAVIDNQVDFSAPAANDKKHLLVSWKTVDTKPSGVSRSEIRALPYNLESELRLRHMAAVKRLTRDYLLWVLAPDSATTDTPVEQMSSGMAYDELVKLRTKIVKLNIDMRDTAVIFAPEHVEDLGLEQGGGQKFRERMYDEVEGQAKGFAGFKRIYEHNNMPKYDPYTGQKKAFGSVDGVPATLVLNVPEVIFHREGIQTYLKPMSQDTRSADPKNEFRIGGHFAADKLMNKGFAALI